MFADEESDDQLPSWCHRGRQATQQLCINHHSASMGQSANPGSHETDNHSTVIIQVYLC